MNGARSTGLLGCLYDDRGGQIFLVILVGLAIVVPLLHLAVPADSPLHVPTWVVALMGKYLCYALLALSVDLIWGFCGILSLGHGAFFALGGYATGMYLMRQIGNRGVYGNPELPDFMVFLNWKELPWTWYGFDSFAFAALMVFVVPGVLGFVFGWLTFRSRVTGVYLSIISQAMTYAFLLAFFRNDMGFGGNNGLTDFKDLLGFDLHSAGMRTCLFVASAVALGFGYVICRFIVSSKLGRILVGIRDAEDRIRFLGYRVEHYKLFVFIVSSMLAGLAGALYVPQVGIINPGEFSPANSIEIVIWVAIGGRGSLYGAAPGAVLVNYGKTYFTGALPEAWLFVLGGLFVAVTLFFPKGIIGSLSALPKFRASAEQRPRPPMADIKMAPGSAPILYLDGVSVTFDGFKALNGLSLYVEPGEMRAIIGPNGAGKTTMMDIITGKTRPDEGEVVFAGITDLTRLDETAIANLGIGRKFQKPSVFENHTVFENLELALKADRRARASLFFRVSGAEGDRIDEVLEIIALHQARDQIAGALSHGQKQWLEIGMLLMQEPDLLLVDEPVAGMTDAETEQTAELLREISQTSSVVVVEHDMEFIRALDTRVTVLNEGSVLAEGSLDYLQNNQQVIDVYLGR